MTSFFPNTQKCSVCGKESEHPELKSTNAFGSSDLDTRPPEMQRSTMSFWVQKCPHCGYVASSLEEPIRFDKNYLTTSEYQNFPGRAPISDLARKFIHKARISIKERNYVEAFWDYLHAAWASDDENDETWQVELRMLAIEVMGNFCDQDMNDEYRVLRADLLRKTRQFERVVKEYEHARFENDLFNSIIQFQIIKAKNNDTATYTVGAVSKQTAK